MEAELAKYSAVYNNNISLEYICNLLKEKGYDIANFKLDTESRNLASITLTFGIGEQLPSIPKGFVVCATNGSLTISNEVLVKADFNDIVKYWGTWDTETNKLLKSLLTWTSSLKEVKKIQKKI